MKTHFALLSSFVLIATSSLLAQSPATSTGVLNENLAAKNYVDRYKTYDDFDKFVKPPVIAFIELDHNQTQIYDNPEYKGKPEFRIISGKLFHKDSLVCSKAGPTKTKLPIKEDEFTERQKEMIVCSHGPFIFYRKNYFLKDTKFWNHPDNVSIRALLLPEQGAPVSYNNQVYYIKQNHLDDGPMPIYPAIIERERKECFNKITSSEEYKKLEVKIEHCLNIISFGCLKDYLPPAKLGLKSAEEIKKNFGSAASEYIYLYQLDFSGFNDAYNLTPYKGYMSKVSYKELKEKMYLDNVEKLFSLRKQLEYNCEFRDGKKFVYFKSQDFKSPLQILSIGFYDEKPRLHFSPTSFDTERP